MKNPFKYGVAVTGENFANREKEIKDLMAYIASAQNVFIFSNRRLGKTSLIKKVLETLVKKREAICIYVDLEKVASPVQFVQVYGEAISAALLSWREKIEKIASKTSCSLRRKAT